MKTLLICTVGGSPEPIVASIIRWSPSRIRFVPTKETREQIDTKILPMAKAEGVDLDPGRYDILELQNGQDFSQIVKSLRSLTPIVEDWQNRGSDFQVVVDFTGGTKCMSAALALHAHRWRCVFSYVGGSERSKEGVGIVISGREQVLHDHNPWDSLGFQAVEDFINLFDQNSFAPAVVIAELAMKNSGDPTRKRELNALKVLAEAYDSWDRFEHSSAASKLSEIRKCENDLKSVLGNATAERIISVTKSQSEYLRINFQLSVPGLNYFTDLLANARRRMEEGRIDDAVARLYRAVESLAQLILAERHKIANTNNVPLEIIPEPLKTELTSKAKNELVSLGLQDAYKLLAAFQDPLGDLFRQLNLHEKKSPLTARNQSILAHGFSRVDRSVFDQLWMACLKLACIDEASLPFFPKLKS